MGSLYTVAALDGQTKHHLEETIRSMATDARNFCVMCVGHNKGWEEVRRVQQLWLESSSKLQLAVCTNTLHACPAVACESSATVQLSVCEVD